MVESAKFLYSNNYPSSIIDVDYTAFKNLTEQFPTDAKNKIQFFLVAIAAVLDVAAAIVVDAADIVVVVAADVAVDVVVAVVDAVDVVVAFKNVVTVLGF